MQSRFVLYCVSSILALATVLWLYREPLSALQQERKGVERLEAELQDPPLRKHLVVASIKKENTSWIQEQLPDWNASIYVADDPQASLTVPQNKGREGMAFLTYIVDHYDDLPDVILFVHAGRYQWHNDDPQKDNAALIKRVQLPYLRRAGYVNLRCVWWVGCPADVHQTELEAYKSGSGEHLFPGAGKRFWEVWPELFPDRAAPPVVATSCCAQFGVSRGAVRRNPRAKYQRWRAWLLDTELNDDKAGGVLEYAWHLLFGQPPVFCPSAPECYCNVFGLCELDCDTTECKGQYEHA